MVCDMITAYSHLLQTSSEHGVAVRRFRPRISNSISILTPGYATRSLAAHRFIEELQTAVARMQEEINDICNLPGGSEHR